MAYILGFTFADGNLYKTTVSWAIQKRDREILKKINIAMKSDYPIKVVQKGKAARLRISNTFIAKVLNKFGLNKIKFFRKLPDIPEKYFRDFLRGFLDGDGWIIVKPQKLEICVGLASANELFLRRLVKRINKKLKLSRNNIRQKRRVIKNNKISIVYQIEWYGKNAIKIIKCLYDNLGKDDLFLLRKYNKQLEARKIFDRVKRNTTIPDVEEKFNKPIRSLLRQLLGDEKLSVSEIAQKLGVRNSTIYEWIKKVELKLPKKIKKIVTGICPTCGKQFKKYRVSKKYCSIACAYASKRTGKMVNCVACNKLIYRPAWWFEVNAYPICSLGCQAKWKRILLETNVLQRCKETGRFLCWTKLNR